MPASVAGPRRANESVAQDRQLCVVVPIGLAAPTEADDPLGGRQRGIGLAEPTRLGVRDSSGGGYTEMWSDRGLSVDLSSFGTDVARLVRLERDP